MLPPAGIKRPARRGINESISMKLALGICKRGDRAQGAISPSQLIARPKPRRRSSTAAGRHRRQ